MVWSWGTIAWALNWTCYLVSGLVITCYFYFPKSWLVPTDYHNIVSKFYKYKRSSWSLKSKFRDILIADCTCLTVPSVKTYLMVWVATWSLTVWVLTITDWTFKCILGHLRPVRIQWNSHWNACSVQSITIYLDLIGCHVWTVLWSSHWIAHGIFIHPIVSHSSLPLSPASNPNEDNSQNDEDEDRDDTDEDEHVLVSSIPLTSSSDIGVTVLALAIHECSLHGIGGARVASVGSDVTWIAQVATAHDKLREGSCQQEECFDIHKVL